MAVAFGVPQQGNVGTTASDLRHITAARWQNAGVISGLDVTGTTSLAYEVAAGVATCQRASSDGMTEAYFPGGLSPTVEANTTSLPRVDCVWVTAHDATQGDADNLVTVGVTQGVASSTPTNPTVPTYATPLAYFTMPAGATSTSSAVLTSAGWTALPFGSTMGILADYWDKRDFVWKGKKKAFAYEFPATFYVPTNRMVEFRFSLNMSASTATGATDRTHYSEFGITFQLDNADISHASANFFAMASWETKEATFVTTVPRGNHTARVKTWLQNGDAPRFHYNGSDDYNNALWIGRRFQVIDRGAAK